MNDDFKYHYTGGYLGLLTWQSRWHSLILRLHVIRIPRRILKAICRNLKGINGYWKDTDEGLYSNGGGDNFAMSLQREQISPMVRMSVCARMVPQRWYSTAMMMKLKLCGKYLPKGQNVRLFKFPGGIDAKERVLSHYREGKKPITCV